MQTGTTALRRAASARRATLLRHGVRYPGTLYNHRQAALALMNRGPRPARGEHPADAWAELLHEIEQEPDRKIWISNDTNRSFSTEEVSLFLKINQALPRGRMTEDELTRILRGGSVARVLNERTPPNNDTALTLADWAARQASQLKGRCAEVIADTGVRVVGDLTELGPSSAPAGRHTMPDPIPVELAAQAVIGAMSGRLHRGSDFRRPWPNTSGQPG